MWAVRLRPCAHCPPGLRHRSSSSSLHVRAIGRVEWQHWCPRTTAGSKPWRGVCCGFDPVKANTAVKVAPVKEANLAGTAVLFEEKLVVKSTQKVDGKVTVRLDRNENSKDKGKVVVGCNLEGNWVLHWGITYYDELDSEWDLPPQEMRPPGSVPIKDYAIQTPLKKSLSAPDGEILYEAQINLDYNSSIATIHFVLKEEETGAWYQYKGRDFRIPLFDNVCEDDVNVSGMKGSDVWSGFHQNKQGNGSITKGNEQNGKLLGEYYKEYSVVKDVPVVNSITVSVMRSEEMDKNYLILDTDIPGEVVVHWGICKDNNKKWQIPTSPHPPKTRIFRKKALQTLLQQKTDEVGNWGLFPLDKNISGVPFVLKLNGYTWLDNMGDDFYIPLGERCLQPEASKYESGMKKIFHQAIEQLQVIMFGSTREVQEADPTSQEISRDTVEEKESVDSSADDIINDIRNIVSDISAEKSMTTKSKETQEYILQEIEKLAAEAYSIFRSSSPIFVEETYPEAESLKPIIHVGFATGSGYEILCQGFNWESHQSGRWYSDLYGKAAELAKFGVTTIWLPPPTASVSPQGYMPTDYYNLNSNYGSTEELKSLVSRFRELGVKVIGDIVLNHRCAQYQNKNGIWNIFGGHVNWDDRAIVADDPHFQGRGNRSSGENFHAAPNIDHSQDFVRRDLKEWLLWLREEIGFDGWRLDFARGFWGGYFKDYMEASGPYFAVGEYWDSLSYTYGKLDHNQDAHRQRMVDWINATNGTSAAFDITTKGIFHTALENMEYWRLSDERGKPPGLIGWWASRAVTFIENHDTGSTQGHWRFPAGKEMQGYAYILTHPGTPTVFYDHIYSHYQQEIATLMQLRQRAKLHCRSTVKIVKAESNVYAAEIDEKVVMKIGPGHYEPAGNSQWAVAAEGKDYKVWESK